MRELNLFGEATDGEAKVAGIDIRRVNVSIIEVKVVSGIGERVSVGGSCVAMVVGVSERSVWGMNKSASSEVHWAFARILTGLVD